MAAESGKEQILLELRDLRKWFPVKEQGFIGSRQVANIKAVDGVNLFVYKGETLGLVGESGCGKTTTGKVIVKLEVPTTGQILYKGQDVYAFGNKEDEMHFKRNVQMIFQDPYSSLNPRMLVLDIIGEGLSIHESKMPKRQREEIVYELLNKVGLEDYHGLRYPHEFSGGQRQRIGIARALSVNPELVVADEPVSALDVSVQAQILNLMQDLQTEFNLTYIFVAHDLSVIKHVSDRVAVMYLGTIVEFGTNSQVFTKTAHPYSVSLMSAIPRPDPRRKMKRIVLPGEPPSAINIPTGCRFHPRCYKSDGRKCIKEDPPIVELDEGHFTKCHYPESEH
ncbi:MAG TPA: oligopeptide/dipeptide ABC transporter ATP-binding protein [candidate division Zixibacteria bacterium]|nr:oligopeptide/dipeptide ABC transporter ATP-binding protein [candidate division Zixibacteria bacterium]